MTLKRTPTDHNHCHANDAEEQGFGSTPDARHYNGPLRPLRIDKKTVKCNYYSGHLTLVTPTNVIYTAKAMFVKAVHIVERRE